MKTFNGFITEAKKPKGAVFTFGRFNPPTTGHAKLVKKLKSVATGGYNVLLFTSHSNDRVKNPLTHRQKVSYLTKFFGKIVVDTPIRTVFDIAVELQRQKYTHVRMVVGSDRVREFDTLLNKYNGVKARHGFYKFEQIEIVSAGERDADADDVSGMSASKLRGYAEAGDFDNFKLGVPTKSAGLLKNIYNDIRKGMGIVESKLPSYMIEDLITEGVYDPGVFKAVFLMGGPGSGKSEVVTGLALKALGLKLINTDQAFEKGLKKAGLSLDLRGADMDKIDPIRAKAKATTKIGMDMYMNGRLGLIFDTTSANDSKIKDYKKQLDAIGYESKMVYVQTSLKNAQDRNANRPRKVPPKIVASDWNKSNANAIKLQKMFGKDFIKIENDDTLDALKKKTTKLYSQLMTWTSKFPKNNRANTWKDNELAKKKTK
jgi:predicted kinase|tara:strand:+ start:6335 stop:7624 length:1290 start_codon:yes stop_codon:yes gene_type:complete